MHVWERGERESERERHERSVRESREISSRDGGCEREKVGERECADGWESERVKRKREMEKKKILKMFKCETVTSKVDKP